MRRAWNAGDAEGAKRRPGEPLPEALEAVEGGDPVPVESLDGKPDDSELAGSPGSEPEQDSPGDVGLLKQEELYEGLSSDSEPSRKRKDHG